MKSKKSTRIKVWNRDQKIKTAIRKVWAFSPNRRQALKQAEVRPHWFECAECGKETEKGYVDHITAVGLAPDWNTFIELMFTDQLQVLDRVCHAEKSKQDLKEMKRDSKYSKSKKASRV